MPSRRAPPVYIAPPLPVFTWSGAYIGINAGYAFDGYHRYSLTGNTAATAATLAAGRVPTAFQTRDDGFTGGAQIGYNYQLGGLGIPGVGLGGGLGGLVIGVEADAAYTDLNSTAIAGGVGALTTTFSGRTEYVGTARGRVGVAFNTLLIYGTGGFAYGGVRDTVSPGAFTGSTDSIRTGYAYGGGMEYAIPTTSFVNIFNSGAVTLKAEFIHYDLGTTGLQVVNAAGGSYTARVHTEGNLARAGINYKLNFMPAVPVVARY